MPTSKHVHQDARFLRPAEADLLVGDASKAKLRLGWEPQVDFVGLMRMMMAADVQEQKLLAGR
jgi:GDPmannose 4,6-dehydratase